MPSFSFHNIYLFSSQFHHKRKLECSHEHKERAQSSSLTYNYRKEAYIMDDEMRNLNEDTEIRESAPELEETTETATADETPAEVTGMTDEEIRAAVENIGTYTSYDYSTSSDLHEEDHNEERPAKKKRGFFKKAAKFVGLAACFGVVAGAAFFGITTGLDALLGEKSFLTVSDTNVEQSTSNALKQLGVSNLVIASTSTTKSASSEGNAVVNVVKENMSSTVCVGVSYTLTQRDLWGRTASQEVSGGGSGFIVGMSESEVFIATNNHVVEKAEKIDITFSNDEKYSATTRATDPDNDLAIVSVPIEELSTETLNEIKVATLGSSDDTEVGEMVIAIGNALGYGQSVTVGYLSAKDRTITYENNEMTLLQTDAAINEGNSGGPLFNVNGEVIGINCAKYSDESVEGMCFAIPISAAIPILDDLMNREIIPEEEQGYLGVEIPNDTDSFATLLGFPSGVYIGSVVKGTNAEKAGLYSGDIITAINGASVASYDQLRTKLSSYRAGTTVEVSVKRRVEGKWVDMTFDVELISKPTK